MFDKEILEPFLKSFSENRDRYAFCINECFYTYNEFAGAISRIRNAVKQVEVNGLKIGLIVNDDLETYAAIFAIWLEGYAYVPLHPQHPFDRNEEIIKQAELNLLLDSNSKLSFPQIRKIETNDLTLTSIDLEPKDVSEDSLAYILFTSGSTGVPKGVQITRRNLGTFLSAFWKTGIYINSTDRCLQCFDLTFDVSVQSFLVPLTRGACTFTIPHDRIKYSYLYGLLEDHELTFGAMAPSMIRYLRPYFNEIYAPFMRYNIITAEASPTDLVTEWSKCIPNAEIYDFYGPTEATIYCTYYKFNRIENNKQINGMLSIGKPMFGIKAIIIDDSGRILGKDQKGELCLSGNQVTPGYWKNQAKNEVSFFEIEFGGEQTRFYRTGDLCCFDDVGDILLFDRLDHQVKIQGYRVELGEIEYHAREVLKDRNVIAIAIEKSNENNKIILVAEGQAFDKSCIMAYLNSKMPFYMVPSEIFYLDQFPLNSNGKIDRFKIKNDFLSTID